MHTTDTSARQSTLLDTKYREFFIPTILMAMTLTMSIVVDSIIVGNMLGADALAAVNLVMPVIMVYNTVAVCLGLGAATLISVAKGRRDHEYANQVFTTVLIALIGFGVLLLLGQEALIDRIIPLLTGEPTLSPLVRSYVQVLMRGTPLIITVPGLAYCLRVDARVRLASAILIVSNLANLVLDIVYMGPLRMGIAGSSLATVSGYVIGTCCLLPYAISSARTLRLVPAALTDTTALLRRLGTIVKTGFPAAMGSILITFKILCINHIVLAVAGKSGMVAFSVCLSCLSFVSMFISGAAQAMTPLVGVLYGEKDFTGVRFVVRRAVITLMIASIAATILLEAAPARILDLFGIRHAADIAAGIPAIRIFSLSLAGTAITFLSMYYYMTIGRTKISTAISVVQGASVVPIALLLSRLQGISGVWTAFSLAEIVTIGMIAACFFRLRAAYPHRFVSPLLLDQTLLPEGTRLELTTAGSGAALNETMSRITGYTSAAGIAAETAATVHTAIHDAVTAISGHDRSTPQARFVDIRLEVLHDRLVVTLRDNVTNFSLMKDNRFAPSSSRTFELTHSPAIGFNNHTLTFPLKLQ